MFSNSPFDLLHLLDLHLEPVRLAAHLVVLLYIPLRDEVLADAAQDQCQVDRPDEREQERRRRLVGVLLLVVAIPIPKLLVRSQLQVLLLLRLDVD